MIHYHQHSYLRHFLYESTEPIGASAAEIWFDADGVLADFDKQATQSKRVQDALTELFGFVKQSGKHTVTGRLLEPTLKALDDEESPSVVTDTVFVVLKTLTPEVVMSNPNLKQLKRLYKTVRSAVTSVATRPGFFENLPVIAGGKDLLIHARELTGKLPHILTAPMESMPTCAEEKDRWFKKHMTGLYDQFVCRADKEVKVTGKHSILVDDRKKNIDKWTSAGGTAIWHRIGDTTGTKAKLTEAVRALGGNEMTPVR